MMLTRRILLAIGVPLVIVGLALACGAVLWQKLAWPARDARRDTLAILPAASSSGDLPADSIDLQPREMPRIEPGTVIGDEAPRGWTHLVLHGRPRVAEGDTQKVSPLLASLVSLFDLTILANVESDRQQPPHYRLGQVAIGLTTNIDGRDVVVSGKTQQALGANLGLMQRNALAGNEACLDQALQIARTPTMVVFDATAIMRLHDENCPVMHRHALLVSRTSGELTTFIWALVQRPEQANELADDKIRLLPASVQEDRKLFVDAGRFVLGLPAQEAFALVDLPPGETIRADADLKEAAASDLQSEADVQRLQELLTIQIAQHVHAVASPAP